MLDGKADAKGFTVLEMVIVVGVIGLLTAIAVPSLVRARMAANEVSALASLRTINGAQVAYRASCGGGLYAPSLAELGGVPGVGAAFLGKDLVPSSGSTVDKSGYEIALEGTGEAIDRAADACTGSPGALLRQGYFASAAPLSTATTGRRYFGTSEHQTVFQNNSAISGISSTGRPSPGGAPVQTRESQEQLNENQGRSGLYVD
jgi:prepilin-type N-terminal cleavage/methylation domain-containing protein